MRLVRPDDADEAARALADWRERGVLVREETARRLAAGGGVHGAGRCGPHPARNRRPGAAATRTTTASCFPHEGTFPEPKRARLELLRATRMKPSPIFLLHHGVAPAPEGEPDMIAELDGVVSRLWRIDDPDGIDAALGGVDEPLLIADGHHRYETALRYHEEEGTEETAYVLAVLVGKDDSGLEIFPTHRVTAGAVPELDGGLVQTPLAGPGEAVSALAGDPPRPSRPSCSWSRTASRSWKRRRATSSTPRWWTTLSLEEVVYTPSAAEAERAVTSGEATAAFLVRAPTVEQVEAFARAGDAHAAEEHVLLPQADERSPLLPLRRMT